MTFPLDFPYMEENLLDVSWGGYSYIPFFVLMEPKYTPQSVIPWNNIAIKVFQVKFANGYYVNLSVR